MTTLTSPQIIIVDFGSQYSQLITRKCRELGFSSVLVTCAEFKKQLSSELPEHFPYRAVILSGGPQSIQEDEEDYTQLLAKIHLPILGICYGMQILAHGYGGKVERGEKGEYGLATVNINKLDATDNSLKLVLTRSQLLLAKLGSSFSAWMSHFDHVAKVPANFQTIMKSDNNLVAAILHHTKPILGIQFHPEVHHTPKGKLILQFFLEDLAGLKRDWQATTMLESCLDQVKQVQGEAVLCAFSGGVDSLVAATLAQRVLKDKLFCFFVDNGLLRPQDLHHIRTLQAETDLKIAVIDAKADFLQNLEGVSDPERKRKIIGSTFIDVFEKKVKEFERDHNIHFTHLLQGTLYPDVIESVSPHLAGGKSATIKSHHNVGGLPEKMHLKLLEPLRFLFKDEVRELGQLLGLKKNWVHRHPFPGPGLGIRILGEITLDKVSRNQKADQILFEELHKFNLYDSTWQAFTVLLPVKTVGVKGDARAYEEVVCLRMVNSTDGMTCEWSSMPFAFLDAVSRRITNEVPQVTRVVYDITSKPPGTIEWE
jgi:GMP synthase (glutamine-hydrolysing)